MTINPFVSLAVYVIVAIAIMAITVRQSTDSDDHLAAAFVAMTWPAWAVITIILSPVIIGHFIGVNLRKKDQ